MSSVVQRVPAGGPWGERMGYSRAVRHGVLVWVSGTTGVRDGHPVGDTGAQTRRALEIVIEALGALGAGAEDVVRTRIYMVDADEWPLVADVHREVFGAHPPAATLVEVARLIAPGLRVEIEALACVGATRRPVGGAMADGDASADYVRGPAAPGPPPR